MIGFGLFLGKFERIVNLKSKLANELCYARVALHYYYGFTIDLRHVVLYDSIS